MNLGERGVVEVVYPASALTELPVARLTAALDDLEMQVRAAALRPTELDGWQPRRGDVVELMSGGHARVEQVLPEGLLKIAHLDVAILELVPLESRSKVIKRVIEKNE